MSRPDVALSPARHAPAILGCAAVLVAAGAGLGAATSSPGLAPDARRLAVAAVPAPAAAHARVAPPKLHAETYVAQGGLRGSLYASALAAGATPALVAEATKLFSRTVDVARDVRPGAPFRLVFDRVATGDGRTVRAGALLYAEIGRERGAAGPSTRFYRFDHDGRTDYLDGVVHDPRPLLLRTPVEDARVTSSFGMRLHPILGFNRLHPGVDLAAPEGSPVVAAGDGVVEEADWAGGYGHWLKIAHGGGFETGYGHLLRYAPGVRAGAAVKQGQVVAFVGSTGLSTGPHLHFEIMRDGRKLDPATAAVPVERGLDGTETAAFAAQKARIDGVLAAPALRLAGRAPAPGRGAPRTA